MLLFNMHKLLPSPEHEASTLAEDAAGEPVELHCTVDEPTAAYVFKTVADPFVGKLSYLRVVSGKVTAGEPLTNARTGDVEKISKPLTVIGKKQVDSDGIIAGDIGAVAKLVSAKTGDTLCDARKVISLVPHPLCRAQLLRCHRPQDPRPGGQGGPGAEPDERGGSQLPCGQQRRDPPDRDLRRRRYPDRRAVLQAQDPLRRGCRAVRSQSGLP